MAVKKFENCLIFIKICIQWVFRSFSKFTLVGKISNFYGYLYMAVQKFIMAVPIWWSTILKIVLFIQENLMKIYL